MGNKSNYNKLTISSTHVNSSLNNKYIIFFFAFCICSKKFFSHFNNLFLSFFFKYSLPVLLFNSIILSNTSSTVLLYLIYQD